MKYILSVFVSGLIIFTLVACLNKEGKAFTLADEEYGLTLSDMQVKITSMGTRQPSNFMTLLAQRNFTISCR